MNTKLRILLVNPVIRQNDNPRHVPFGLAQLASIIKGAGHHFQVFDCNAWRPSDDQIWQALRADEWDVVATGGLITSYGFMKDFCRRARQARPESVIVMGGACITPIPREIMSFCPEVDVGVIGEGYLTFGELLDSIADQRGTWQDIEGIAWRSKDGTITINRHRELLEDLDSLPFPAWEMFPLHIYFRNSGLLLSEEAMQSTRRLEFCCSYGCAHTCKYCFHLGLSGELSTELKDGRRDVLINRTRKVRYHSPEYVVELAKYAREKFRADFISFLDENFAALDGFTKGRWMNEFEILWKKHGLQPRCLQRGEEHDPAECSGIHWGTTCHASAAKPDLLRRFRELGCSHLDFGFESFSDGILRSAGKGSTAAMNKRALLAAMKAQIRAIPNQMFGFPGESFQSIYQCLRAWDDLGIKTRPFFVTPYPGSEWYYTYREKILEQYEGDLEAYFLELGDATTITAAICEDFNAVELLGLRELMINRDLRKIRQYEQTWRANRSRSCSKGAGLATNHISSR